MLTMTAAAQNRSIEFHHGSFAELLAKAKAEKKMIYIDCYTTWCGPCKWMAKNVFTNDTAADFYNANFVNAKIDMEKGEGIELAQKYSIQAYPPMFFLDANGVQPHRPCGSSPAAAFINSGKEALSPNTQLATYAANFNAGKASAPDAARYFSMLQNACQSYGNEVNHYFTTVGKEDLSSRANWNIIYRYVEDYNSAVFTGFEADKDLYMKKYGKDSVENKINQVYNNGLFSAIENKDMKSYEIIKGKMRMAKTEHTEMIILGADIKLAQRSGDWKTYASLASGYVEKYSSSDKNDLNSFAWAFYEHVDDKAMLEKAESWSKKATELDDNYAYNDTYAAVLYKLGKRKEAKAAAQKAIGIAKKNGEDYRSEERRVGKECRSRWSP